MNLYGFILDMSDTRVMLICFVHAKHNDLGIVLLGSWGLETVALSFIIGAMGAQLQMIHIRQSHHGKSWKGMPGCL